MKGIQPAGEKKCGGGEEDRTSNIERLTSNVEVKRERERGGTSNIERLTSNVEVKRERNIEHRTFNIERRSADEEVRHRE
jgi:hypothetical protein